MVVRTQLRRIRGMVKSFARTTRCSLCSVVITNPTQFLFFQIIRQNVANDGFWYTHTLWYLPTANMVVVLQNSWHPSDVFIVPSLPLCSASSIDSSPVANRKPAMAWEYRSMRHGRATKRFYKHFPPFHSRKSRLQQNFMAARCSKFFPW